MAATRKVSVASQSLLDELSPPSIAGQLALRRGILISRSWPNQSRPTIANFTPVDDRVRRAMLAPPRPAAPLFSWQTVAPPRPLSH